MQKNIICFFLTLFFGINVFCIEEINEYGFFSNHPINIRNGYGYDYSVLFTVNKADTFKPFLIKYKTDDWCLIRMFDGRQGWVKASFVKQNKHFCIAKKNMNIFFRPFYTKIPEQGIKIGKIEQGVVFKCIPQKNNNDFLKTNIKSFSRNGWILKRDIFGIK